MFVEALLESKNQDCLEQVLSFLTCNDLASAALTTKTLHRAIFGEDDAGSNINTIWQGAEQALTNRSDRQAKLREKVRRSFGSNAREHCRLFVHASKAAMAFESSDGVAENRMDVSHVLAYLLNVREYDIESVIEKLKIGVTVTETIEEAASKCTFGPMRSVTEEDTIRAKEEEMQRREKWNKLAELTPPEKSIFHEIFVRITRTSTGKVVSQGFCDFSQKLPWYAGLEMQQHYTVCPGFNQGLQVFLDFESLEQSEEMQSFQHLHLESESDSSLYAQVKNEFIMTAVAIDTLDYSVSCLYQHGQANGQNSMRGRYRALGRLQGMDSYSFDLDARWGHDCMQMGSSIDDDRFFLSYSLSLNVMALKDGSCFFVPSLDMDILQDKSVCNLLMQRQFESMLPPGATIQTVS